MSQSGGELRQGGQAVGPPALLEALLELPVGSRKLLRGFLQPGALLPLRFGKRSDNKPHDLKHDELGILGLPVLVKEIQ